MQTVEYVYKLKNSGDHNTKHHHPPQQQKRCYTSIKNNEDTHHSINDENIQSQIKTTYSFEIPWYLKPEYRKRHELSLKDMRDLLACTPVPCLLQLALILGCDLTQIMSPDALTDNNWLSLQQWFHQTTDCAGHYTDHLFKDDTRLQTILVNTLYKFFEREYEFNGKTSDERFKQSKCVCPFDTHIPPLPIHTSEKYASLIDADRETIITSNILFNNNNDDDNSNKNEGETWICRGAFHGYQQWQNQAREEELILIQVPEAHEFLQKFALNSKKRKEVYVGKWFEQLAQM